MITKKRKGGLFMHDLPWIVFSQTGNIETYLLMKDMEIDTKKDEETIQDSPLNHELNKSV